MGVLTRDPLNVRNNPGKLQGHDFLFFLYYKKIVQL